MAWFSLAVLVIGIIPIVLKLGSVAIIFPIGFVGVVLFGASHAALAYFVRCPECNKCLTVQGFKSPVGVNNSWSYVAAKWFTGSISCIHCGSKVNTNAL